MKTQTRSRTALGSWSPDGSSAIEGPDAIASALERVGRPMAVVELAGGRLAAGLGGTVVLGPDAPAELDSPPGTTLPLRAYVPAVRPESLGDPEFRAAHGVRYAYVAGEMANGIASVEVVEAMARAGMLGFFGSAGLPARARRAGDRPRYRRISPSCPAAST